MLKSKNVEPQSSASDGMAVVPKPGWGLGDLALIAVLALACAAFFLRITELAEGDFLNSYPFISSDGFDWIYEGHWLVARLSGTALPPLLILRNPGFVAVTAADAWLGAGGKFIALALAGAVFVTHVAMVGIARLTRTPRAITAMFVLASLVAASGFYRTWILSDSLAVCLMVVSVWGLVEYRLDGARPRSLVLAGCAAAAGGLTQSYALIPFCVGAALFGAESVVVRRRVPFGLLVCALLTAGVTAAWRSLVPHMDVPSQWSLLRPTLAMAGVYVDTWGFVVLPFLPLAVACASRPVIRNPVVLLFGAIVAVFMAITFAYQWPDARFTDIYAPFLMLGAMAAVSEMIASLPDRAGGRAIVRLAALTAAFLAVQGAVLAPASDWSPSWKQVSIRPIDTWLSEWGVTAKPVDRFGLKQVCRSSDAFCEQVTVPQGYDPYATRILSDFLAFRRKTQSGSDH